MTTKFCGLPRSAILLAVMASVLPHAHSAVTAEEAAKLKSSLTPFGAEKAGNKDGTIPAWTGGHTQVPAGYKGGQPRPDFFAGDKPQFAITSKNVDQHAGKLTETTKAMLKKYPNYRLDIYQTRRTAAAPQWVYDNTYKNATQAKTVNGGYDIVGAFGGVPFPIPKDGYEVIWNHRLGWAGETTDVPYSSWVVTGQGKRVMAQKSDMWISSPYYHKEGNPQSFDGNYLYMKSITTEPSSKAGEGLLSAENLVSDKNGAWQYLVGQRRVRRAPSINYDTPNFISSGIGFFDETFGLGGKVDRHEFKLIGKKEIYVPYNNNRAALAKPEQLLSPNFLNPDLVRWELHRVWVVEASLREGKRHMVPKRTYYIDEDTWKILLSDGWDGNGQLWRGQFALTYLAPDVPALMANVNWGGYNVQTGEYYLTMSVVGEAAHPNPIARKPQAFFSPETLASDGAR
jgi:hypothetical protein